jgi:biopolymer transport protein ExbD
MAEQPAPQPASQSSQGKAAPTDPAELEPQRSKKPKERGIRQLNLTSMLDVTFQLLIFFILTANFAIDEGVLAADLPQGKAAEETPELPQEPVRITVRAVGMDGAGIIIQNGPPITEGDFAALYRTLEGMRIDAGGSLEPDNPIIILPTPNVEWRHVVSAFNAVVRAEYTNVSFAQSG